MPNGRETGVVSEDIDARRGLAERVTESANLRKITMSPWAEKDAFDRMLVVQAQMEAMVLLSNDPCLTQQV